MNIPEYAHKTNKKPQNPNNNGIFTPRMGHFRPKELNIGFQLGSRKIFLTKPILSYISIFNFDSQFRPI